MESGNKLEKERSYMRGRKGDESGELELRSLRRGGGFSELEERKGNTQ